MDKALVLAILALILVIFLFIWLWASRKDFLSLGSFRVLSANFCPCEHCEDNETNSPDSFHSKEIFKDTIHEPANTMYNAFPKEKGKYLVYLNASEENCEGRQFWALNNGCDGAVMEIKEGCGVKILHSEKNNIIKPGGQALYLLTDINTFRRVA